MQDNKDRYSFLGEEKMPGLIIKLSVPSMAGMSVVAFYNVIDRIFVGKGVGIDGLAGVVINFPVMMIVMAFSLLLAAGAGSAVSIKLGRKKADEAENVTGNAFILSLIAGLILTLIIVVFMKKILIFFGGKGIVLEYAGQFLHVAVFSFIFQITGLTMNNIIRAEGNAKIALLTLLIGTIVNTALNPVFIFILHMGVRGSGLATLISQIVSAAWTVKYFYGNKNGLCLRLKYFRLKPETVKEILNIGISPFIAQISLSLVIMIANIQFGRFGNEGGLVTAGIVTVILMLFSQVITGILRGIQPVIGYNFGSGKYERVKEALKISILSGTIICMAGFIPLFFYSRQILSLFSDKELSSYVMGAQGIKYAFLTLPLLGFIIIGGGYFQAAGKPKQAVLLIIIRQLSYIASLLILPRFFGFYGGVFSFPLSDIITITATIFMLSAESRNRLFISGTAADFTHSK